MKKLMLSMAAVPLLVSGLSVSASAAEEGISIFDDMKFKGEIRPRYEFVDDGNSATANANAITARTKLQLQAKLFGVEGLSSDIGIISVNNFGAHYYNPADGHNYTDDDGKPYAKVVDPQFAMISNADINYKTGKTLLHAGRSQVNLDNQRFIGTVGWRQLERSYDTVFVADNSVENLNVLAAWVYGYQGVKAGETTDTNSVLLHASYKISDPLTITVYDYMLASIHDTYGAALTGKTEVSGAKLDYRVEGALQSDPTMTIHGNDNVKADAYYMNFDLGADISGVLLGANYELLSGHKLTETDKTAFTTPLATGHKFNGWADKFLSTPAMGLQDMNVRIGYKAKGFGKVLAVYHQFVGDTKRSGENDLGNEIDVLYANAVPGVKDLKLLLKGAMYNGGKVTGYTNDVQKYWVQLDYKFKTK